MRRRSLKASSLSAFCSVPSRAQPCPRSIQSILSRRRVRTDELNTQGCKLVRSEKGDKLNSTPPIYIYIYIYIYTHTYTHTQGWESQGTSRYDIITIQRFCDNLYIARQSYNDTARYLSNYANKMPVKRLSASFLSLFKSKLLENSKKSTLNQF